MSKLTQRLAIILLALFSGISYSYQNIPASTINSSKLIITNTSPAPNYHLSTDNGDIYQLTDHNLLAFPIWSKIQSVGWHDVTPIKLSAEIPSANNGNRVQGTLSIHTAKGLYAGVKVLRRVDVYSSSDSSNQQYVHSGEFQGTNDEWADKKNHWVHINVNGIGNKLEIVIHADGTNIFIDEMVWQPNNESNKNSQPNQNQSITKLSVFDDSTTRLKNAFLGQASSIVVQDNNSPGLVVWKEDPWGDLSTNPAPSKSNLESTGIQIVGTKNEKESIALGIINTGSTGDYNVTIAACQDLNTNAIELGILDRILSASGKVVFDPILPITKSEKFQLESRKVNYLWLSIDLSKLTKRHYETAIVISSNDSSFQQTIPLYIDVINKSISIKPHVNTWAYTTNEPIWNNPDKNLEDIVEHGVNVFVIPPKNIPYVDISGEWNYSLEKRLKSDLDAFKGKGQILLVIGWGPEGRPTFLNRTDLTEDTKFNIIKSWLTRLDNFMKSQGLNNNEWALYPTDEIFGDKIDFFIKAVKILKKANPNVRIYANPTQPYVGYLTYNQLKELEPYIDIWQPEYTFATDKGKRFFSEMSKPWWIYNTPSAPVKEASPLNGYRMIAWRSWNMGASGFGFWSYSDTRGASTWDDFDGGAPDWAVVYEGDNQPISSRRWEAFREGIEDYQLLKATENLSCFPSSLKKASFVNVASSQTIEIYRQQMLSCLREH